MIEEKLKECRKCGNSTVKVDFLGKNGHTKIFTSKCLLCGYDYMFMFNKKTGVYCRTGNLNGRN